MNSRLFLALTLLVIGHASTAIAQAGGPAEKAVPPTGPLLARATDLTRWTVSYSYPKPTVTGFSPPVRLQTLTVAKSKNIYFEQKFLTDGSTRENWRMGDMQINLSPGSRTPQIYDPMSFAKDSTGTLAADPSVYTDYSRTDFPGCEWASVQTYIGIQKQQGEDCLVFQQKMGAGATPPTLYVSLKTRLPIRLESMEQIVSYRFEPLSQALSLPPDLQQFLDKRARVIRTMTSSTPSF